MILSQEDQESGEHSVTLFTTKANWGENSVHYNRERMLGDSCSTQACCGLPFGRTLCDTDRSAGNKVPEFNAEH